MRKLLLLAGCLVAVGCGGKLSTTSSPSTATTAGTPGSSTPGASATDSIDQSDYLAATACKIHDDITAKLASGGKTEDASAQAIGSTGAAGSATDVNARWHDLKAALDAWEQAIPDATQRGAADVAVKAECQKVPPSLRSAVGVLPS